MWTGVDFARQPSINMGRWLEQTLNGRSRDRPAAVFEWRDALAQEVVSVHSGACG